MARGAEAAKLHALAIDDLLGVTVAPLDGYLARRVGIHQHVEGAVALQLRKECHRCGDLAEQRCDLGLDLGFGLLGSRGGGRSGGGRAACFVFVGRTGGAGFGRGFGFLGGLLQDLDLDC